MKDNGWRIFVEAEYTNIPHPNDGLKHGIRFKPQIIIKCDGFPNCEKRKYVPITHFEKLKRRKAKRTFCSTTCKIQFYQLGKTRSDESNRLTGLSLLEFHKTHPKQSEIMSASQIERYKDPVQRMVTGKSSKSSYKRADPFDINRMRDSKIWNNIINFDGLPFCKLDFVKALERQGGKCGFPGCNKLQSAQYRAFDVDHDHGSGKFRSLLCNFCNYSKVSNYDFKEVAELYLYFTSCNGVVS